VVKVPPQRRSRSAKRADKWSANLDTVGPRAHAWIDLLFFDHGLLRLLYRNRHRVTSRMWRSSQPTPGDLRREKAKGIKTVICVRSGLAFGSWPLEREACKKLQLELHKVNIRGRQAPSKSSLIELIDLFSSIEYPVLVHCKSGADRSGFVAAVYLMAVEGRSPEDASAQLSARYGHLRHSRAGILGAVIDTYRREGAARGIDFRTWVETSYDPQAISRGFRPRPIATAVADLLLRRET
jgi:protein tyrosine/serine phosphatase